MTNTTEMNVTVSTSADVKATKPTKRMLFTALLALVAETAPENAEILTTFINNEIALLDKRSANKTAHRSKTRISKRQSLTLLQKLTSLLPFQNCRRLLPNLRFIQIRSFPPFWHSWKQITLSLRQLKRRSPILALSNWLIKTRERIDRNRSHA